MRKAVILATVILAAAIGLSSCNHGPSVTEPDGPIRSDRPATANSANRVAESGDLPPPGIGPRFVGKWAADEKSCKSAAWLFTATTVRRPDNWGCSFARVSKVPGGYDVEATCGPAKRSRAASLKIRFAESAKAMILTSTGSGHTGLVFCGRAG